MVTQRQIQDELSKYLEAYALIYKSKQGNWKVMWNLNDKEDDEIKSIILNKLSKNQREVK